MITVHRHCTYSIYELPTTTSSRFLYLVYDFLGDPLSKFLGDVIAIISVFFILKLWWRKYCFVKRRFCFVAENNWMFIDALPHAVNHFTVVISYQLLLNYQLAIYFSMIAAKQKIIYLHNYFLFSFCFS